MRLEYQRNLRFSLHIIGLELLYILVVECIRSQ